jgi:hypothetical protein
MFQEAVYGPEETFRKPPMTMTEQSQSRLQMTGPFFGCFPIS